MIAHYRCYWLLLDRYSAAWPHARRGATTATPPLGWSSEVAPGALATAGPDVVLDRVAQVAISPIGGARARTELALNFQGFTSTDNEVFPRGVRVGSCSLVVSAELGLRRATFNTVDLALKGPEVQHSIKVESCRCQNSVGADQNDLAECSRHIVLVGSPHLAVRRLHRPREFRYAEESTIDVEALLPDPADVLAPRLNPRTEEPSADGKDRSAECARDEVEERVNGHGRKGIADTPAPRAHERVGRPALRDATGRGADRGPLLVQCSSGLVLDCPMLTGHQPPIRPPLHRVLHAGRPAGRKPDGNGPQRPASSMTSTTRTTTMRGR